MAIETDHPSAGNGPAPAAADAADDLPVQEDRLKSPARHICADEVIAALFARDKVVRHPSTLPPHVLSNAITVLEGATCAMAGLKNVPLAADYPQRLAAGLSAALSPATVRGFLAIEKVAIDFVARTINRVLDTLAATRVLHFMWEVEGFDRIDVPKLTIHAGKWVSRLAIANDMHDTRYRWPERADMVTSYYNARTSGPASVRYPQDVHARARYYIGGPSNQAAGEAMAIPLLFRCAGLPGTFDAVMPDGRCIKKRDDGLVCTSWWKDGQLHRDAKDGPARVLSDQATGAIVQEEYFQNGLLHRDGANGPAVIDTNFEGREIRSEEHYSHGRWHRPVGEGPAVKQTDTTGRCVREFYAENGERHRDPSEGPAWWGIDDGVEKFEYMVRDKWHRAEAEGPALLFRDLRTGIILNEAYYQNDRPHRLHGPAAVERDTTGQIVFEGWFRDGVIHRDPGEGPAWTRYDETGGTTNEQYVFDGNFHRDPATGPAIMVRDAGGIVIERDYWFNGERLEPDGVTSDAEVSAHV